MNTTERQPAETQSDSFDNRRRTIENPPDGRIALAIVDLG